MAKSKGKSISPDDSGETLPSDMAEAEDSPFGPWLEAAFDADWGEFAAAAGEDFRGGEITLSLDDLISDNNNEVVLVSDPSLDSIKLVADSPISGSGLMEHHVTADGQDVSGYHFLSFETGLTLFYGDGVHVVVESSAI
jgi:hypothetical protein